MVTWLAPIAPFTTEEAWLTRFPDAGSLHLRTIPDDPADWTDEVLGERMERLRALRRVATGALEVQRRDKVIGSSLEAAPIVHVGDPAILAALEGVDLAEWLITSGAHVVTGEGPDDAFRLDDVPGVAVVFARAEGIKCARSWKFFDPTTALPGFPDITARDARAVMAWDAAQARR
jgi:isoleucyl-tRNA synthetase